MNGRPLARIGLLLPFGSVPTEANALYEAAELALFEAGDPNLLLIPRDSGADMNLSAAAAAGLARDGADVIVGPLMKEGVLGAARTAQGSNPRIPVIGFSSDNSVAGNGAFLLSIPFEEEVARISEFATRQGLKRFALMAPNSDYGHRVDAALRQQLTARGGSIVTVQFYQRSEKEAAAAAALIAPQARAGDAQALIIADSGAPLRAIGPALLQAGVDLQKTRLIGIGWYGGDALREPTLAGGWYAGPDPGARAAFEQKYRAAYGHAPTRLASLAYDAVALSEVLSRDLGGAGINATALQRPDGFNGADGLFRFRANGTIERALAVLQVQAQAPVVLDPAPRQFPGSGS
jgi:ABC-type branched-subunit amino acid transport system substrate-binding protein